MRALVIVAFAALPLSTVAQQTATPPPSAPIPPGSRVFFAPMEGFESDLAMAFVEKKVPLKVVFKREEAEFEITGSARSTKASTAKKIIFLDWRSTEEASIQVSSIATGEVVFAYAVHKPSAANGRRSTAEACAKHLKKKVLSKK